MRSKRVSLLVGVVVLAMLLMACTAPTPEPTTGGQTDGTPSSTSQGESQKGRAVFAVTDAAADMGAVSSVEVTIDSVRVHSEGGVWTEVSEEARSFALLDLQARAAAELLAQAELEAGTYNQIELNVSKVVVVDAEGSHEATLPSGQLQLKGTLEVESGATATATFDFIADQSLHITGEGRYILAPVIQVETRASATAEVQANNEVHVSGGETKTNARMGMDIEGNVDLGLAIPADAQLSVSASGSLVQVGGSALLKGTIKAVDTENGVVTLMTKGGKELKLHLASDSSLNVDGSAVTAAELAAKVGAEVVTSFNAGTKALTNLATSPKAAANARATTSAEVDLSGTIKSVNSAAGTVTIETATGAEIELKIGEESILEIGGGLLSGLLGLRSEIGAQVQARYDASTRTVTKLEGSAEAEASINGTLKSVNALKGTITLTTQSGADVTLNAASNSRLFANGSLTTLASLRSMVDSEVVVGYRESTKVIVELNARGQAEGSATLTGVIKAVNPAEGTITIETASGSEVVLNVTSSSSIVADGAIAALVDLKSKIGAQASAEYNLQSRTVLRIATEGRVQANTRVSGTLSAVNATAETVTVTTEEGTELVLDVTASTKLLLNGSPTKLTTLGAYIGSQAIVEYNFQTKVASSFQATARVGDSTKTTVSGTLSLVNLAAGTVTVTTQEGEELTLDVTADTELLLEGAVTTLVALAAEIGSEVALEYDAEAKLASRIEATGRASASAGATASGTLSAVNSVAGTATVTTQAGTELVLDVTATTEMLLNGSAATLASLAAYIGTQVAVEYNSQTMAASRIQVTAQVSGSVTTSASGTLKSVNMVANTVTIATATGADLALKVTSETVILVDGSSATLAEAVTRIGAQTTVEYETETNTATRIETTS